MTPHDLAQTPSHTIPHDGAAHAFRCHKTSAERLLVSDLEQPEHEQSAALRFAFCADTRELDGARQPPRLWECERLRAAFIAHAELSITTGNRRLLNSAGATSVQQKSSRARAREDFANGGSYRGLGWVAGVLASVASELGDAVVVVFVVLELLEVPPPAGEGFTMVVLFSVAGEAPPAAGVTSVLCSHAPRSAALARMQISFFIYRMGCPVWDKVESERGSRSVLPNQMFRSGL